MLWKRQQPQRSRNNTETQSHSIEVISSRAPRELVYVATRSRQSQEGQFKKASDRPKMEKERMWRSNAGAGRGRSQPFRLVGRLVGSI